MGFSRVRSDRAVDLLDVHLLDVLALCVAGGAQVPLVRRVPVSGGVLVAVAPELSGWVRAVHNDPRCVPGWVAVAATPVVEQVVDRVGRLWRREAVAVVGVELSCRWCDLADLADLVERGPLLVADTDWVGRLADRVTSADPVSCRPPLSDRS